MNKNTIDPDQTIVLYEPDEEVINMYRDYFLLRFNTEIIREIMMSGFHSILMNSDVRVEGNIKNSHANDLVKHYKENKGAIKRNMMAALLAVFVSDIRNMMYYMETLSDDVRKVMELVSLNHIVSQTTLEKETGKSWLVKSSGWGPAYKKAPELVWIECTAGKSDKSEEAYQWNLENYFHMDVKFRPLFMPFFIPKDKLLLELSESLPSPSDEPLQIFNAGTQIFSDMPVLNGLYRQGSFSLTENMKLSVNAIKKLGVQMNLKEFYPDGTKLLSYLRASMVMPFYYNFMKGRKDIDEHPEVIIKEVFQRKLLSDPAFLLSLVLPHITGLRSLSIRNAFGSKDILEFCGFLFDQVKLDNKAWINFEQLFNNLMLTGVSVSIFPYNHLGDMHIKNKMHDYPVFLDKTFEEISVSFFKGLLFLMAAFGLVEIAYTPNRQSDPSPFSSLRYFRLTDLGLYAFGFSESFTLPEIENEEKLFELDDENMIVRSLVEENPYESLLSEMSEPIGKKRYKITRSSLLKGCVSRNDVVHKIDFFKRFISNELPQAWEDFFNSLVERCQPMKEVKNNQYLIYQLDPADKELLHLLSTDPEIRKYTHRVEGHMLLVELAHRKDVLNRLKIFGYLL